MFHVYFPVSMVSPVSGKAHFGKPALWKLRPDHSRPVLRLVFYALGFAEVRTFKTSGDTGICRVTGREGSAALDLRGLRMGFAWPISAEISANQNAARLFPWSGPDHRPAEISARKLGTRSTSRLRASSSWCV